MSRSSQRMRAALAIAAVLPTLLLSVGASAGGEITKRTKSASTSSCDAFKARAERGEAPAQAFVGVCYDLGEAYAQNYAEAVKWYQMSAAQGFAAGQYLLATMYAEGHGVAQNDREAFKLFRLAADQGFTKAIARVGSMYGLGRGVPQDFAESARWLARAAAQGDATAQFLLGRSVQLGLGGAPPDLIRAHMWFNLSASLERNPESEEYREEVARRMTPEQLAEAQKLARECRARNFKGC